MALQAINHRGVQEEVPVVTGEAAQISTRNDDSANAFIAADRDRLSELQAELPPVSPSLVMGSPAGPVRQAASERSSGCIA